MRHFHHRIVRSYPSGDIASGGTWPSVGAKYRIQLLRFEIDAAWWRRLLHAVGFPLRTYKEAAIYAIDDWGTRPDGSAIK